MIEAFAAMLVALVVWGPSMVQRGNSPCLIVDADMAQHRPCRWDETR